MSEMDPGIPEVFLEHFEYEDDYQDQAKLLDESLFRHRRKPLYQTGDFNLDIEELTLVPNELVNTPFDKVVVNFSAPSKDPYEPFVRIQMQRALSAKNYIVETDLMYFDNKYLAIRSVYTVSESGGIDLKMGSNFESEVTTEDLRKLNRIINNSAALV